MWNEPALRERLAALEHEQWAAWTRYMLDHISPEDIERWRRQIDTPYEALSEHEKRSDREWADRVLEILEDFASRAARTGAEFPGSSDRMSQ